MFSDILFSPVQKKLVVLICLFLLVLTIGKAQWLQIGTEINGMNAGDHSGYSVSLSGDGSRVAIAAPGNAENGVASGQVRVYQLLSGVWSQMGNPINGEAENDQSGHSISLSANGQFLAIGAPGHDSIGMDAGQVRVFEYSNGDWQLVGHAIYGASENDLFGYAVSLSVDGTKLVVGAPNNENNGNLSGHVRVFQNNNGLWEQIAHDIDGEAAEDLSGSSVSISGDGNRIIVGAPGNDGSGFDAGQVRVYALIDENWVQLGADLEGNATTDAFGHAVSSSLDGNIIAIGAQGSAGGGTTNGYVKVFQYALGSWTQIGSTIHGEYAGDFFGYAVSLSANGGKLAVGAIHNGGNGLGAGHGRLLEYTGNLWKPLGADIDGEAVHDECGKSISLSALGNRVAIGADFNDSNGGESGHARIFKSLCHPADLNGDGVVNSLDFLVLLGSYNTGCIGCVSDINLDGFISVGDFLLLLGAFGTMCQ